MPSIRCGSCGGTHEEVWQVKACYGIDYTTSWEPKGNPTPEQAATQAALYAGAVPCPAKTPGIQDYVERKRAAQVDELQRRRTVLSQISEGIYESPEGSIFKVQKAVHGSGRLYAKRLRITEWKSDPKTGDPIAAGGTFTFEPGLIHKLQPTWKVTKERALEFGKLYGFCIRCAAQLTKEESIERGMGDICAGKFS